MAQKKQNQEYKPETKGQTGGETGQTTSGGGTAPPPTATQIVENSWAPSVDGQTAQQFASLTQIRQARTNQLQRQVTSLTTTYGATDPRVVAAQASLSNQQTFASRLGVVSTATSTPAPTAPANGWTIYGHVLHADQTPAPQLTVFLADECRAWLQQYAYAFTDQTGYYTLSYTPQADSAVKKTSAAETGGPQTLTAYLEVSNCSCQLMYIDASPMPIPTGAVISRDILLAATVPLGTPPCEPGASPSLPPGKK